MDLGQGIGAILAVALIAGGGYFLYAFVRYGLISTKRTEGESARMRQPEPDGIAALAGFPPSNELIDFYRRSPLVGLQEFYLVDRSKRPPSSWFVARFYPLTPSDVREQLKIAGAIPGIPIADDMGKGTYFVDRSGAVMLDSPNIDGRRTQVASSIGAFAGFEVRDTPPDAGDTS